MVPAAPARGGRAPRGRLRAARHRRHADGRYLVAGDADTLAWAMLAVQALADLSLAARRRAPMIVIAILAAFTLAISLLISAGALTPAHAGNVWAPFGTVLAAYGLCYYRRTAHRVGSGRRPDRHRRESVGPVGDGDHGRRAQDDGRAAAGAVFRRPLRHDAGPDRARRAGRAGALPARRAGQGRRAGPAGGRDARCRDPPGELDGAAPRRWASPRPTRPPGGPRRNCGPRAARRWSCGISSASCGPHPTATRCPRYRACPR